jgi:hypothetical protein
MNLALAISCNVCTHSCHFLILLVSADDYLYFHLNDRKYETDIEVINVVMAKSLTLIDCFFFLMRHYAASRKHTSALHECFVKSEIASPRTRAWLGEQRKRYSRTKSDSLEQGGNLTKEMLNRSLSKRTVISIPLRGRPLPLFEKSKGLKANTVRRIKADCKRNIILFIQASKY